MLAQYLWGNGLIRCNGEYPLTDGRVNIRLSTNATQQVTSTNQPDAFGIGSLTSGTASAYSYGGAVGYRQDGIAAAGLPGAYAFQKVGARYYDPTFGAFLTRDIYLSQKPYAYCDGDPVNFSDPSGHKPPHKPKPGQPEPPKPCGQGGDAGEKPGQGLIEGGDNVAASGAVVGGIGYGMSKVGPAGAAFGEGVMGVGIVVTAVGGAMRMVGVGLNNGLNLFGPLHSSPMPPKIPTNSLGQPMME